MTLVRFNPFRDSAFREMEEFINRYHSIANEALGGTARESVALQDWRPSVDVRETADAYLIDVEIPGVQPADVQVTVKDRLLTVSGERRDPSNRGEDTASTVRVHRVERRYGRFARSFALPDDADEDAVRAAFANGVLELVINRRVKEVARSIEIAVH